MVMALFEAFESGRERNRDGQGGPKHTPYKPGNRFADCCETKDHHYANYKVHRLEHSS
jgi:hypothetical protein